MIDLADVAVVVANAKAAARWWTKNLGFATFTLGGRGHAILVAPPGDRFVLHLCEGFAPLEPGDTGIAFVTDAIEPLIERLQRGSVRFPEPITRESWGVHAKFADPDGNIFWLLQAPRAMVRSTRGTKALPPSPRRSRRPARLRRSARSAGSGRR